MGIENGLTQFVRKPTRNVNHQSSNILDLIFSNDPNTIQSVKHMAPLGKGDHDVLLAYTSISKTPLPKTNTPKWKFSSTDFDKMREEAANVDYTLFEVKLLFIL